MHIINGILDNPLCTVFKAGVRKNEYVKDISTNSYGNVSRIWAKHHVDKTEETLTVWVTFEYTIQPTVKSYNSFRAREADLRVCIMGEDSEGTPTEVLLEPSEYYEN